MNKAPSYLDIRDRKVTPTLEQELSLAVLEFFRNRRGFPGWFDKIDDDVKDELFADLTQVLLRTQDRIDALKRGEEFRETQRPKQTSL